MFTEDLKCFFDTADHGVDAIYTTAAGKKFAVRGIFNNEYDEITLGAGFEGAGPLFTCASADIPGRAEGDTMTIAEVDYTVVDIRDDGTGVTEIRLVAS